jgi:hypothetical protein
MLQRHNAERTSLIDQQGREFQDSETIRKKIEPIENDHIEQERTALNIKYAEERERTRQNTEEYQNDRQSLIEKLKQQWVKKRENEREH